MIPSDMKLKIRSGTVGYNNKILISDGNLSLGKNNEVNLMTPARKNHKTNSLEAPAMKSTKTAARPEPRKCNSNDVLTQAPAISQKNQEPKTITHNDKKNCIGTGSGRRLCNMEYISIKKVNKM